MPNIRERLSACMENGALDSTLLPDVARELDGLRHRVDELETVLIMLVRTGWPWREDGEPNDILDACKDGYAAAMREARELLGLDYRSAITRTEPKT